MTLPEISREFYVAAAPVIVLSVFALIALMQSVFGSIGGARAVYGVLMVGLGAAFASVVAVQLEDGASFIGGTLLGGDLSRFGQALILGLALLMAALMRETHISKHFLRGEVTSLYLMVIAGMLVMIATDDLITLFVGLELASIGLYALIGYIHPTRRSQEGAIKYFVLGSFAAAVLLFGFALLYAGTGSMRISEIVAATSKLADHNWIRLGGLFTLIGLGFKLALAPFHLWAPDAYEAAPTGITGLMATTVKIMIVIVSLRIFGGAFSSLYAVWLPALSFLAIASMIIGNIMALVQTSLKRMLAYSSIAHSGYMAIAICALSGTSQQLPVQAIMFYLLGYAIVSVGAFGVIMMLETEQNDNLTLDDLSGLAAKRPWMAFALATFMFSFGGMPPTVGFIGKFFVFNAAVSSLLFGLLVVGAVGSTIALYYYLRVVVRMYMSAEVPVALPLGQGRSPLVSGILVLSVIFTILLGTILPAPALEFVRARITEVTGS
jgi:NADH-quinone oxidoreductase subunit N